MISLFLLGYFKTMGGLDHILSYLFLMQLNKLNLSCLNTFIWGVGGQNRNNPKFLIFISTENIL